MQDRWGEAPLVTVAVCLAAGIAVSALLHQYIFVMLAIAAGALAVAAWLSLRGGRLRLCLGLGLCALAADGVLLGLASRDGLPLDNVRSLLVRGQLPLGNPVLLEGCVAEDPTPRRRFAWTAHPGCLDPSRRESTAESGHACRSTDQGSSL